MWRAENGWFSPDSKRIAYVPNLKWQTSWKRYRGGQTTPIYIVQLSDLKLEKVPRENSNDSHPVWFGETVYFLSDRNGPVSLFAYDTKSKQVSEALHSDGLDFKTASAGPGAIIIEMSTITPETSQQLYEAGRERGIKVLDVAISGSTPAAEDRKSVV